MFNRPASFMRSLVNVVFGLIGGVLLGCALCASASLLLGVREFSWYNPFSWGVLLGWNWDTTWKAAVIGLLISLVVQLRRNRPVVIIEASPIPSQPRSARNDQNDQMMRRSPYNLARTPGVDLTNPMVAQRFVDTGMLPYLSASQQDAIRRSGIRRSDTDN